MRFMQPGLRVKLQVSFPSFFFPSDYPGFQRVTNNRLPESLFWLSDWAWRGLLLLMNATTMTPEELIAAKLEFADRILYGLLSGTEDPKFWATEIGLIDQDGNAAFIPSQIG